MRVVECGAGNLRDARALVFEYMAATVAETSGRAAPSRVEDLPAALRAECEDLGAVYRAPGTLLLAYAGGAPAGCAGLADRGDRTAEPFPTTSPVPMVFLRRPVSPADIRLS